VRKLIFQKKGREMRTGKPNLSPCWLGVVFLVLASANTKAQESHGSWITDARTKCHVWNVQPEPKESITWSGACAKGLVQGHGVVKWFQDGKFREQDEGNYHDGKLHGHGVSILANGDRYEGHWRDAQPNGHGILTLANGDHYEGHWRDGKANGHGMLIHANGDRYDGDWRDDKQDGHGVSTRANGDRYDGDWRDGKVNGHGILTLANDDRYEGDWRDGKQDGHGILTLANDDRYEGDWRDGCFRDGNKIAAVGREVSSCP
jgi:hypothetical protein